MKNFTPYKFQDRFNNLDTQVKEYKKQTNEKKRIKSITLSTEFYQRPDSEGKKRDEEKKMKQEKKDSKLLKTIHNPTTPTEFITIEEGPHTIYL